MASFVGSLVQGPPLGALSRIITFTDVNLSHQLIAFFRFGYSRIMLAFMMAVVAISFPETVILREVLLPQWKALFDSFEIKEVSNVAQ